MKKQKKKQKKSSMLQWRGQMDHSRECNRAVLVSVAKFDYGVDLDKRSGAKKDVKELHRTLSRLGFKVDIHNDLSADEIYELFHKGNTHNTHSVTVSLCVVMCSLTDGSTERLLLCRGLL